MSDGEEPGKKIPLRLRVLLGCGGLVFAAAGCRPASRPEPPPAGLELPEVSGLAGPAAAAPESTRGKGEAVTRLDVIIEGTGKAAFGGTAAVRPWRGVNLPRDAGPLAAPGPAPGKFLVEVSDPEGKVTIKAAGKTVKSAPALGRLIDALPAKERPARAVLDAPAEASFGPIARVVAVLLQRRIAVEFRAKTGAADLPADEEFEKRLAAEALRRIGPDALSTLGVRLRADRRASWLSVQGVLLACMKARVWRVSFAALSGGREVGLGRVTGDRPESVPAGGAPVPDYREKKKGDIFRKTGRGGSGEVLVPKRPLPSVMSTGGFAAEEPA